MHIITLTNQQATKAQLKSLPVVVESIDAMIPTQDGTTLFLRGGKHIHVVEPAATVVRMMKEAIAAESALT
jgi:ABC-type uncharacterized transport system permease subunit